MTSLGKSKVSHNTAQLPHRTNINSNCFVVRWWLLCDWASFHIADGIASKDYLTHAKKVFSEGVRKRSRLCLVFMPAWRMQVVTSRDHYSSALMLFDTLGNPLAQTFSSDGIEFSALLRWYKAVLWCWERTGTKSTGKFLTKQMIIVTFYSNEIIRISHHFSSAFSHKKMCRYQTNLNIHLNST